jgi:hypothetical protein
MENQIILEDDYLGVLIQWLFFFGIFTVWLLPAFLFRSLSRRYNKKGWLYFIIGLGVGIASFYLAVLLMLGVKTLFSSEVIHNYLSVVLFIVAFSFVWLAFRFLKNTLLKNGGLAKPKSTDPKGSLK